MAEKPYPAWVCEFCGKQYGRRMPSESTTWHHGNCGVCNREEKWIKENMIYNNACRHFQHQKLYLIMGKWVIEWVQYDHTAPAKDDE